MRLPNVSKILLPLVWLLLFLLLTLWRLPNLDAYGLYSDEGIHLMWARLVADGYPLYAETQAVQWPLFIETVSWGLRLWGQTLQAGRCLMLPGFALLAVSLSWLSYRRGGWPAAFTALILVAVSPLIFTFSRLVMADVPALGLVVTAVVPLTIYLDSAKKYWLALSGLIFGLSLVFKPIAPFFIVPGGYLLLCRHSQGSIMQPRHIQWRPFIAEAAIWTVAAALPVAAVFLIYTPSAAFDQLVFFRGDLRAAVPHDWIATLTLFQSFIISHWGYLLLAIGGIFSTFRLANLRTLNGQNTLKTMSNSKPEQPANPQNSPNSLNSLIFWVLWLISGMLMLLWHTPLFAHHFIVLLPPLIFLAAQLVSNLLFMWRYRTATISTASLLLLSLCLPVAILNLPAMVAANQHQVAIVTGGREREAAQFLQAISTPADFIMGDGQLLIFLANRRTPPPLGDVALVGIKAGRQTSARMTDLTRDYQSPAVVQWNLRLPWLPDYVTWVQQNYLAHRMWDNDHIIHYVQRFSADTPLPNALQLHLGDAIQLRGYQLDPGPIQAGQTLGLKLYWQLERPLTEDYTVFTQLLDSNGLLVAGHDSQPLAGHFPTSQWPVDEIITDVVQLPLPDGLPPGEYTLVTGMYLLETLERLPVIESGTDFVPLTTVTLTD